MFSIFPAALAVAGVVAIFFYPLRDSKVKVIEAELKERHASGTDQQAVRSA
jgi:Na+/melibiose symporter-like transporter